MKAVKCFCLAVIAMSASLPAQASKYLGAKAVDKDYVMVQIRDGEVRYRDIGTGESAYLGHSFAEGDDTLKVFGKRLDVDKVTDVKGWTIKSKDDKNYGKSTPVAVYRKSKPMNVDHNLDSELDHTLFVQLPKPMKQGCTYTITLPAACNADAKTATVKYDVFNNQSEALHVNIIGYTPSPAEKIADLYLWLGEGGQRDYSEFVGKKVWLYNVNTGEKTEAGKVNFWKPQSEHAKEANKRNNTGSDVWSADFVCDTPGRYRLVVEDVGCSMDFDISDTVYSKPFEYSVRGYYYMRLGEKPRPDISPVPRQPAFIPNDSPEGFVVYKTDLHPWSEDWRKLHMDVWDEPHFKPGKESIFYAHRLPGNPTNDLVKGGHSDAFDWDRHLAHVSNIYDMLLPFILTGGAIDDDNLGIAESGNGIPDIIDEARNEVDFFLSIRDGEGYSQGVTNPSSDWDMMFQAGCTTMAAWANAANCAILAEAFRIDGNKELADYYAKEAITAYRYAERQADSQLDDHQLIGDGTMRGIDFKNMAAAFLYNLTGDRQWEDEMAATTMAKTPGDNIWRFDKGCQTWAVAAYLTTPRVRHYTDIYSNMVAAVNRQADNLHVKPAATRPSRRSTNDPRWQTSENLQLLMLAHAIAPDTERRQQLEKAMIADADWCMGRNPSNTVEMTGLGQRHITDCYTTGRNDGVPGSHPGHTPFNGTETWSPGDGGDARILLSRCYPDWNTGGWPSQESFFNQRYMWVNGEFTPRETMRGKMALVGYLYGINK